MIRKLAHLNFVTNNLDNIIDFYVNKLGMKVNKSVGFVTPMNAAVPDAPRFIKPAVAAKLRSVR